MFGTVISILKSGRFAAFPSTQQLLLSSAIGFAQVEEHRKLLLSWHQTGQVSDLAM